MITILGGGVAGSSVAMSLGRRGARDVHVFDAHPGEGSTHRALGGFRTQHGSELNVALAQASREWFAARADRIEFQANGYLYLAESEEMAAELAARAEFQRGLGLPIEHPPANRWLADLVTDDIRATNYCALDGLYKPPLVLAAMREEAAAAGVTFHDGEPAVEGVVDASEAVVIACGVWSREVGEELGVTLPVTAVERGVWQVGPFEWLDGVALPMTLEAGTGYHFRERDGHLVVMGPGDQKSWTHYREWLARRLPPAAVETPAGHWTGDYEMTFDHHALIGPTERPGCWACTGFSGHGVMQSPAVGEALAAMILGETPAVDISALSPLRTRPLVDRTQL